MAQTPEAGSGYAGQSALDKADFATPVTIDGRELFEVRGVIAQPARTRAETIEKRIIAAAQANGSATVEMEVTKSEFGLTISADGHMITVVTEADAALEQVSLAVEANVQAAAIRQAILNYRADRTRKARLDSAAKILLWTVMFALLTVVLEFLRRRGSVWITRIVEQNFESVDSATQNEVQADALAALARYGFNLVLVAALLLEIYYFLTFVLLSITETRPLADLLLTYVTGPILRILEGIVRFLPDLVMLIIIYLLARFVIKGLRAFFNTVAARGIRLKQFEPHWASPTFNLLRVVVILIALVFAFPYIPGSDSAAFKGLTLLIGAMLSLGSNSVMSNILSGLFLVYRRSTNIGDRIRIGAHTGDVVEIKLMETYIRSIKNELISIPNVNMLNSEVINYSRKLARDGLLLHTTVGIGYEEPPDKVEAMLLEAARRTDKLKKKPAPFILWTALADFAINYQVNAYTTQGAAMQAILSDLLRNIVAVFNENGVQIMTPAYVADPSEPKVPGAPWDGQLARREPDEDQDQERQ